MNAPRNSAETVATNKQLAVRARTNVDLAASTFPRSVLSARVTQHFPFKVSVGTDLLIEDTFNRNTTLSFPRPYESPIFVSVQEGNIPALFMLLETGQATVHDVDPYGLGLLYVRPPTWRQYNRD